jgi:3'-5' exoribonuclease
VLAGVLLHDIGKLESYRWEGAFEMTVAGSVAGHVVLGAIMLDRRYHQAPQPPCTPGELLELHHLILSHHGKLEFGAPVTPMTLEAEILHYGQCQRKAASMDDALRSGFRRGCGGQPPIWQLDRRGLAPRPVGAPSPAGRPVSAAQTRRPGPARTSPGRGRT